MMMTTGTWSVLVVVAVLGAAMGPVAGEAGQCGVSCVVNTDCGKSVTSVCGLCMNRVCRSGCAFPCTTDGDCGDANCKVCDAKTKTCGSGPVPPMPTAGPSTPVPTLAPAGCGGECVVDSQCGKGCPLCMKATNATSGRCGDGCGLSCTADAHCLDTNCPVCNATSKKCGPRPATPAPSSTPKPTAAPGVCGDKCTVDAECSGECQLCFKATNHTEGTCGTGCGMMCTTDAHCLDSNCGSCNATTKRCEAKKTKVEVEVEVREEKGCGASCVVDAECGSECAQCLKRVNESTGVCGMGCGMPCKGDGECLGAGCSRCNPTLKRCEVPAPPTPRRGCGESCVVDTECVGSCTLCMRGRCGQGCGFACTADSQCGAEGCGRCEAGKCVAQAAGTPAPTGARGGCGATCVVNTDCGGRCGLCFKGENATKGVCGAGCGAACAADGDCGDANCGTCDATKKTCGAAAPPAPAAQCNERCVVNTDCVGNCTLCMLGRCAQGCGFACTADSQCGVTGCGRCDPKTRKCTA